MFVIPSLGDLVTRARQAFRTNLPGSDAWIWPNNINPTAKVFAGMVHEVFGFADYIQRQKFALTADSENLDLHGEEFGLARRPAAPARGSILINFPGAGSVDAGALFERADGIQYRALAAGSVLTAGALSVDSIATTDGATTTAIAGTPLDILSGVTSGSGDALAQVDSGGINGGADIEPDGPYFTADLSTFRGRILFRKRNPPHGGSGADYVIWASSVSGVTRVFVERLWNGAGTVRVFPLMDQLYASGIAPPAEIQRVTDYIETVRPAGAIVTVAAPTSHPINITISGLTPDTSATREAVLAELAAMFLRNSVVAGIDTPHGGMPFLAIPSSFSRSWIWQAVANAAGEERHIITSPVADVALIAGELPTLGIVTFA